MGYRSVACVHFSHIFLLFFFFNTVYRATWQVVDKKGWEWRLMLMPDGNSPEASGYLSVFVEHVNKDEIRDTVRKRSGDGSFLFVCSPSLVPK